MKHFTFSAIIEMAKRMNASAGETKDWRLSRKIDRAAREEARKLNQGRGYVIATPTEIKDRYPEFVTWEPGDDAGQEMVWAFRASVSSRGGRCRINLVRV